MRGELTISPIGLSGLPIGSAGPLDPATVGGRLMHLVPGGLVGSPVSQWSDTVAAQHLTQGTAGRRPTRSVAALNGFDVATFDNADDFLNRGAALTGLATGATYIAVVRKALTVNGFGFYSQRLFDNLHPWNDGIVYDSFCASARKTTVAPVISTEDIWRVWSFRSTANLWKCWINTTEQFSTTSNTFATGTDFIVGCGNYDGVNPNFVWNGSQAEHIVYDSFLADDVLSRIVAFLKIKYALP